MAVTTFECSSGFRSPTHLIFAVLVLAACSDYTTEGGAANYEEALKSFVTNWRQTNEHNSGQQHIEESGDAYQFCECSSTGLTKKIELLTVQGITFPHIYGFTSSRDDADGLDGWSKKTYFGAVDASQRERHAPHIKQHKGTHLIIGGFPVTLKDDLPSTLRMRGALLVDIHCTEDSDAFLALDWIFRNNLVQPGKTYVVFHKDGLQNTWFEITLKYTVEAQTIWPLPDERSYSTRLLRVDAFTFPFIVPDAHPVCVFASKVDYHSKAIQFLTNLSQRPEKMYQEYRQWMATADVYGFGCCMRDHLQHVDRTFYNISLLYSRAYDVNPCLQAAPSSGKLDVSAAACSEVQHLYTNRTTDSIVPVLGSFNKSLKDSSLQDAGFKRAIWIGIDCGSYSNTFHVLDWMFRHALVEPARTHIYFEHLSNGPGCLRDFPAFNRIRHLYAVSAQPLLFTSAAHHDAPYFFRVDSYQYMGPSGSLLQARGSKGQTRYARIAVDYLLERLKLKEAADMRKWVQQSDMYDFGIYTGMAAGDRVQRFRAAGIEFNGLRGFDTFNGNPDEDGFTKKDDWSAKTFFAAADEQETMQYVKQAVGHTGVHLVPGSFNESLTDKIVQDHSMRKAFWIHLGCATYASTLKALDWMFRNSLVEGGRTLVYLDAGWQYRKRGLKGQLEALRDINAKYGVEAAQLMTTFKEDGAFAFLYRIERFAPPEPVEKVETVRRSQFLSSYHEAAVAAVLETSTQKSAFSQEYKLWMKEADLYAFGVHTGVHPNKMIKTFADAGLHFHAVYGFDSFQVVQDWSAPGNFISLDIAKAAELAKTNIKHGNVRIIPGALNETLTDELTKSVGARKAWWININCDEHHDARLALDWIFRNDLVEPGKTFLYLDNGWYHRLLGVPGELEAYDEIAKMYGVRGQPLLHAWKRHGAAPYLFRLNAYTHTLPNGEAVVLRGSRGESEYGIPAITKFINEFLGPDAADMRKWMRGADLYDFGVYTGVSLKEKVQRLLHAGLGFRAAHGFDTFQGHPASDAFVEAGDWSAQHYFGAAGLSETMERVRKTVSFEPLNLVPGPFNTSLTGSIAEELGMRKAFWINMDCDTYQSTFEALDWIFMNELIEAGVTFIYFDDGWYYRQKGVQGQLEALQEISAKYGVDATPLMLSTRRHGSSAYLYRIDSYLHKLSSGSSVLMRPSTGQTEYHNIATQFFIDIFKSGSPKYRSWLQNADIYEFGIYTGKNLGVKIKKFSDAGISFRNLYGFDSFQGLPEADSKFQQGDWNAGAFFGSSDIDTIKRKVAQEIGYSRTSLIPGMFNESLTPTLAMEQHMHTAFWINIDCDLYTGTFQALDWMFGHDLIEGGKTHIYLDDGWYYKMQGLRGELEAFEEISEKYQVKSTVLLSIPRHKGNYGYFFRVDSFTHLSE